MKNKHGGKRKGAGRNPSDDPRTAFSIRVKKSILKKIGKKELRMRLQEYSDML